MCGIAGIFRLVPSGGESAESAHAWTHALRAAAAALDAGIAHRGPDGQGTFEHRTATGHVILIHRRLAIIDREGGAQPMAVRSTTRGANPQNTPTPELVVTFNGCIYNHREVKADLVRAGHGFVSNHSDTEVLARSLVHSFEHGLEPLEGMFAVGAAHIDERGISLLLARDRCGEKPLYYIWHSGLLMFASTAAAIYRALAALRGCGVTSLRTGPSTTELRTWLTFGFGPLGTAADGEPSVSGDFTPLREVLPGTSLTFTGDCSPDQPPRPSPIPPPSPSHELLDVSDPDTLYSALQSAVGARLEADVPLACFLSGGVDSSLITFFTSRLQPGIRTFCVRMPDVMLDESLYAQETARALGTQHTTLECPDHNITSRSAAADITNLIEQLGLPFADSSLLPTYWLSQATREHVPVALSGDGGDELFAGYRRHVLAPHLSSLAFAAPFLANRSLPREWQRAIAAAADGYSQLAAILSAQHAAALTGLPPPVAGSFPRSSSSIWQDLDPSRGHHWDLANYLPGDLLRKVDTASMSVALEVRAPFLDSALIRGCLAASDHQLMPWGRRKALLRSLARRVLPTTVATKVAARRKQGFAIPVDAWFRTDFGNLASLLEDLLHDTSAFSQNVLGFQLDRRLALSILNTHRGHGSPHGQQLYSLLCMGIWSRWACEQNGSS
jgi:asparagine synthase (glutamine-hydrolysing)